MFSIIEGRGKLYFHDGNFIGVTLNRGLHYEVFSVGGERRRIETKEEVENYFTSLCKCNCLLEEVVC
jgi:hypothetical protein